MTRDTPEAGGERPVERLTYFTDAVTAIALTLLALELPVPHGDTESQLWHSFGAEWADSYLPFLLSFVVIAAFWWAHHELYARISYLGPGLASINALFLLMIVMLPYATRVLSEVGRHQVAVVLYATVLGVLGFTMSAMGRLVLRRGWLRDPDTDAPRVRSSSIRMLGTGVVFLVSIPVAFWSPTAARYIWFVLILGSLFSGAATRRRRV